VVDAVVEDRDDRKLLDVVELGANARSVVTSVTQTSTASNVEQEIMVITTVVVGICS
jgi:hypothetical protein